MEFQRYKITLTVTLVLSLICVITTAASNVKQTDGQTVNGCHGGHGHDGRDGHDGRNGRDGRDGIPGPCGPPGLPGNVQQPSTGGATYVRWGRNVCPPKTLTLYSGFMAGSYFSHSGGGANNMCLPKYPQWNRTVAGYQSRSKIHGTEFELESNSGFHRNNAGGKSQRNHEAQCAVCQTPGRLTMLMVPARLECPSGWNLEYLGFLMSQREDYHRAEYVCVDQDPDADPATIANEDGNLIYNVEVVCGSLPCPPYVDGYEVTCVVCTQ